MFLSIARYFQALPNIVRYQPLLSIITLWHYTALIQPFQFNEKIKSSQTILPHIQSNIVKYCLLLSGNLCKHFPIIAITQSFEQNLCIQRVNKYQFQLVVCTIGTATFSSCYLLLTFTCNLSLAICYQLYVTCFLRLSFAKTCFLSLVVVRLVIFIQQTENSKPTLDSSVES